MDLERTLFATSITNGTDPAALYQWTITQNGVINKTEIINANSSNFEENDFSSYNLEVKIDETNDDVILAWITKKELTNDKVFVVIDGDEDDYDLNLGNIAGIEFSIYEDNVLYVSCPGIGIVKLDYNTGIVSTPLAGSQNYGHSFLQTAPDGHIYAVADDGTELGQINQGNSLFYPAFFTIPDEFYIFSTYRIIDNAKYFILPENDHTYDPLLVSVTVEGITCPGYPDGTATICVTGGTPGIYPDPEYNILCIGPQGNEVTSYYYDPVSGCFYFTGLSAGLYSFHITDDIGTYYDGTFTVESYNYDLDYIEINNSMTWDDIYPLHSTIDIGIRVKSNATLTINDAILEFGHDGKIEIEAGAKIVSNNTVLRNLDCEPQQKWKGIEVWGNKNLSQYSVTGGNSPQGVLELNSSTVLNAENGVAVWALENNYWWTSGGIVKAVNSTFKNNTKSVHFIPYENTFPPTGQACNNLSYFKNCNFILNYEYIDNTMFYKHVDLHGVSGIDFYACEFSNAASNGVSPWNNGIASYRSKFKVDAGCDQPIIPCPEQYLAPSTFNGFYRAISAHGSGMGTPIYEVWNAEFTNNTVGIYNIMVPDAVMVDNEFNIGLNGTSDGDNCDNVSSFGIDIHAAAGYAIENNYFTKINFGNPGNYVGVRLDHTESIGDDVYNNEFIGLSVGNLSENPNRPNIYDDSKGVAYLCNENSNNNYDFHVANNSYIKGNMGSDETPSGNSLSQNAVLQFRNDYTQDIRYYYYDGDPLQELTLYSNFVYPYDVSTGNTCPDHYSGGGTGINVILSSTEKGVKQQVYSQNMADYILTLDLINTLKDGGDTPLMENEIETAWPDEMWILRADLLANSPHLSFEVLKDVADRTDVFTESVQFDIFAANPDEMRSNFLTYLETKTLPMPQYMVDMLRQIGYGSSYKTVLKNQLASYYGNAIKAAQDILRSELFDSIPDMNEERLWLGNIGAYQADKQIIASYLQEGDFTNAQTLLDQLPVTYSLSGDDLLAYNDYNSMMQLQINLMQEGRTIFELDSIELATITYIAEYGYGSAVYQAQSILEYAHGYHYYDCPALPDSLTLKQHHPGANIFSNDAIHVSVKPNPAHTWVAFDYTLPFSADEGAILIIDISGQVIENIRIDQNKGQKVLDTRHIPAGVYIYRIESSGYSSSGKLVIR
ncbi:MAG: T9SS type A sorting domain-containing protein [Bacteroidales bacterium]|nr:T9SS type A sorting domain-containing protein [Bacteroidales bacterium]